MEKNEFTTSPVFAALRRLPRKGLFVRMTILAVSVLAAAAVVLSLGWIISGNRAGLFAGAAAGAVCLLAAEMALAATELLRKPQQVLPTVIVGMTIRMGTPLAAAIYFREGPLANAGFLYYLIVFYLVTLTVETLIALPGRLSTEKNVPSAGDFVG